MVKYGGSAPRQHQAPVKTLKSQTDLNQYLLKKLRSPQGAKAKMVAGHVEREREEEDSEAESGGGREEVSGEEEIAPVSRNGIQGSHPCSKRAVRY
ncbi:hypothetical protein GDO81_001058 [Engystomops pustulosus]|uniref:Uncharacterized protein n=1 Tax=Engystomops pustulosus TaxID=76066 RepID=A0AAV7D9E2_ENGPU|nr:hypothetical protein GDO81_001058 [Engystomops pustulosus]